VCVFVRGVCGRVCVVVCALCAPSGSDYFDVIRCGGQGGVALSRYNGVCVCQCNYTLVVYED